MQRLHLDDLTGHLLRAHGWTHVVIPAIATEPRDYEIGRGLVRHREVDDVLQPDYESRDALTHQKRTMSSLVFEAQYQQNPVPDEGAQIKWEWLHRYTQAPNRVVGGPLFQSWDTASTPGELGDYSVGTTWYKDEGIYYLLDVRRKRVRYPELKKEIGAYAAEWNCRTVVIEDMGAGRHLI